MITIIDTQCNNVTIITANKSNERYRTNNKAIDN